MTKYRNFRLKSDDLPQGQQFAVGIYKLLPEACSDPQVSLTTCGGGGWWLYDPTADGSATPKDLSGSLPPFGGNILPKSMI
jgi:hypothetical protein